MYLKQLEIQGFKSFAEKTLLQFLPPRNGRQSITAIVGPNGSGKSNVSDAIRWVMGEQSMKTLRGKKSEDIIFSGSASKGQMGMAHALLTLDNSDKRADVEYEELVIGRRFYRSGEGEYLINGNSVRLFDLQVLLAKAQFGQGSYAVIGQGMIDQLILQSPTERKNFFDEASGIKEFQIKRHQASLRLARTKEHIAQAELLLQEIDPRLKTLSRQVKKLAERQEVELKLKESQESYYTTLSEYHQTHINTIQTQIDSLSSELEKTQKELLIIQEELAQQASESSRQEVFEKIESTYQEIVRRKNHLERDRAVLQGKLEIEYTKVGQQNRGWLEERVGILNETSRVREKQVKEIESSIATMHKHIVSLKQQVEEIKIQRTAHKSEIQSLESQLVHAKSEQTFLYSTGLRAVQAVMEGRKSLGNVYGTVAELGKVDKKYNIALDVAAGSHLSSLVVENDDVAKECIEYLRREQLGVATFLPINKIRPREVPPFIQDLLKVDGVIGLALDLIRFEKKFEPIFSYVFGSTLVVDSLRTAQYIGIGRVRMVTLEGDLLETSGSMKGGYRKGKTQGLSFAGTSVRSHEMALDLEEQIQKKQNEFYALEEEIARKEEEERQFEGDERVAKHTLETLLVQKKENDTELSRFEQELSILNLSPEQYGEVLQSIADQKKNLEEEIVSLEKEMTEAESKIRNFNDEEEKKKQRVFALQDEMQVKQQEVNVIMEKKNKEQVELAKLLTKQEDLENEVFQEMQCSLESIVKRAAPIVPVDELEVLQTNIQKLKYTLSLIGGIDQEVIKEYEETRARHEALDGELTDLRKAMNDLEQITAELDDLMKKRRNKAFKQIKKEFARYFEILFEGGEADLIEMYGEDTEKSDEELEVEENTTVEVIEEIVTEEKKDKKQVLIGIEIVACPPGKKIKHLQSLSGGERTLTSLALMCAILRTNPSPFIVLDEVEAALDEANTLRVVNIIKELATESQFILITHNRVTMHAADALYGVTMGNDGISHLLSVKMEEIPAEAAS